MLEKFRANVLNTRSAQVFTLQCNIVARQVERKVGPFSTLRTTYKTEIIRATCKVSSCYGHFIPVITSLSPGSYHYLTISIVFLVLVLVFFAL